jgi:CHAT domain-containing protein/predicted negative regulator of RcsB-dependent stress response
MSSSPPVFTVDELVGQLAAEPQKRKRHKLLQGARELWNGALVSRLYDEMVRLARIDLKQAERLADSALWTSEQLDDDGSRAVGLRAVGHVHFLKGDHPPALEHYQAALQIYESLGKELEVGRTLSGALQTLIYLGRYDQAFDWAQRAYEIFSRHGDCLRLARLDTNMANILYRQDRFEEALELYHRALAVFTEIGNPQDLAIALKNMATCQISLTEFRDALATYQKAREVCVQHQMPLLVAEADYNIAYLYYLRGEYTRAIELYRSTREHCHELGDSYHEGLCDLDQSEMYLELNLSEEGAHLAKRAYETFRQLGMGYEMAKAMANIAIASSHHGDSALALELFRESRELFEQEHNHAWTAMIDLYQALVFYQDGRLDEARNLCQNALGYFAESPLIGKAALCQLLLARIHLGAGRVEDARRDCLAAMAKLEQAESPALSYQAHFVFGQIQETLGDTELARQAYRQAHERLENLRSHLKTEEMKIAFLKDKLAIYEALVRMLLAQQPSAADLESAFIYIEQAKSRSLADLIAFRGTSLLNPREAHQEVMQQVSELREELNWYTRAIQLLESGAATLKSQHIDKLRRAARQCEASLIEAVAGLRVEDKEFANLEGARSIDLESIRSELPENAILLQYYRVQDTYYACLLSRRSLKIVPTGSASELRRVLQLLRFQLSKFRLGPDYARMFEQRLRDATNAHLREFYRQLIEPIERDLDAEHLIVAPHEVLHYLPFQALLKGDDYFGDRYTISYSPSASVYYLCCAKSATASRGTLVMGVPDAAAPYIEDEVKAVASVMPGAETFLGPDATLDVLRDKGAQSRFIHIATHGWFRQDNPMFSSISLGNSELSLFDLYQLSLPAELVTLSGCGTGLNVVVGGDELVGLKRGLLYAGAQGVLLSLWDVNDQSTADFMKLFYERLSSEPNKAKAVQYAMKEIRKQRPHPFYWAPFVLVGKYE